MGRVVYEIPAGKLDSRDEDPLTAARRELREETGYTAERMTPLGVYIPSPAILTERITLYLAEGLSAGETSPDEDEFLFTERRPLEELCEMVMRGEIEDGKTQTALLKTLLLKQGALL
jgi:ADP-ribose pyrophosphatase